MPKFTPTEQKLLNAMSDGLRHFKLDLFDLLPDGRMNGSNTLSFHIVQIRKKINPIGQDIICEYYQGRIHYRHVRLIGNSRD